MFLKFFFIINLIVGSWYHESIYKMVYSVYIYVYVWLYYINWKIFYWPILQRHGTFDGELDFTWG